MGTKIIYLVDDDRANNFLTRVMLEDAGFVGKIVSFLSANEAFVTLQAALSTGSGLPAMIFLDINLPGMDGWEFVEEFSKIDSSVTKDIRLYMLSSSLNPDDVQRVKRYACVREFLSKPISEADAARLLAELW